MYSICSGSEGSQGYYNFSNSFARGEGKETNITYKGYDVNFSFQVRAIGGFICPKFFAKASKRTSNESNAFRDAIGST